MGPVCQVLGHLANVTVARAMSVAGPSTDLTTGPGQTSSGIFIVTFDLPAYAEQAVTGLNTFTLSYGANDVTGKGVARYRW
jgi:hypothetical protein